MTQPPSQLCRLSSEGERRRTASGASAANGDEAPRSAPSVPSAVGGPLDVGVRERRVRGPGGEDTSQVLPLLALIEEDSDEASAPGEGVAAGAPTRGGLQGRGSVEVWQDCR